MSDRVGDKYCKTNASRRVRYAYASMVPHNFLWFWFKSPHEVVIHGSGALTQQWSTLLWTWTSTYRFNNTIVTLCHPGRYQPHTLSSVMNQAQASVYNEYLRVSVIQIPYKIQTDVLSREKVLLTRVQTIFNTLLKVAVTSGSIRSWRKSEKVKKWKKMTAGYGAGKF